MAALAAVVATGWEFLAVPLGVVASGLALGGLALRRRGKPWAGAALVLALSATVLGALRLTADPTPAAASAPEVGSRPAASSAPVDPDATVVEYRIVTDGLSVTHLSYVDVTDDQTLMVEKLGVPPPFEHVIVLPVDTPVDPGDLSVTGLGGATSTSTTCTISVNGEVVAKQTAEGSYGVVSCAVPPS